MASYFELYIKHFNKYLNIVYSVANESLSVAKPIFTCITLIDPFHIVISLSNRSSIEKSIKKIVSEYDQEIPQSQTADNPVAPRGRAAQPSQDTRKTN